MRGIPLPTARSLGLVDPDNNLLIDKLIPRLIAADDDQAVPALGELSAIVDSVSSPTEIYGITYGDGATIRGVPVGALNSSATVFVGANGTPSQNGTALLAAYDRAKALTPNGAALAADNRAVVIIGPGVYDLGSGSLTLDTEFVDLIGLDRESTLITSSADAVIQTADDVMIREVHLHTSSTSGFAYSPSTSLSNAKLYRVRFSSDVGDYATKYNVDYAGTYIQCATTDRWSFGFGSEDTSSVKASGTFIECEAGDESFAAYSRTSGLFIRCKGGVGSFGSFGFMGSNSGTFIDCEGGDECFSSAADTSATYIRCRAGDDSFGAGAAVSGKLYHCIGGANAFGGDGGSIASTARIYHCVGGAGSFGGTVDPSAKILFCVAGDAEYTGGS